jgi:NADH-quinone oxidoreductase subunit D
VGNTIIPAGTTGQAEERPAETTARSMTLNMGPQHPSTHGVLRLELQLDGETIVGCRPDIGYLHTGIEKEFEQKTYQQAVTLTDRIDYLAPLSNNLCYCLAVEKLLGLEIPPKAQWTRVMLTELTRLNSHLVWLGTHAIDIGAMSVFLYCFREREEILRIFEMFSGQRMMTSYFRVGGLALDHPRGWHDRVKKFIDVFPSRVDEYEELLTNNPIWIHRTRGVGFLSLEDMLDLGVTGPMIRAAGLKWDIRKDQPYSSYDLFDFEVPTRAENDVYARYQVRVEEMRQSARIIQQALAGMPEGRFTADAPGIVLPDREKMKTQMEALIYHFKIVTEGFRVPEGEVYQAIESPRGEVGYYVVSDGTAKPYRVHVRGPSFGNLQAVPAMVQGTLIADVIASIGSMDFVLGDTDR